MSHVYPGVAWHGMVRSIATVTISFTASDQTLIMVFDVNRKSVSPLQACSEGFTV